MKNLIAPTPPVVNALTRDNLRDTLEARIPCLIDGYAAELRHRVNTKHQDRNIHSIILFDPKSMEWKSILDWGYAEVGHIPLPVHDDRETVAALNSVSELVWSTANVVVAQSRLRMEEVDRAVFEERARFDSALNVEAQKEMWSADADLAKDLIEATNTEDIEA